MAAVFQARCLPCSPSAAPQRIAALVVVALHAGIVAALLSFAPARNALLSAAPIMVEWIAPKKIEAPEPAPATVLPRPKPVVERVAPVLAPPPLMTAPEAAPSPVVAPAPPPAPLIVPPPAPVVAATPAPLPMSQPVFDADTLDNPAPSYPPVARRNGEQGRVLLRVLVSAAGAAEEVQVRSSSGFVRLDDAALETVRRWKFLPARRGSEPVPAWVLIPVSFKLRG